MKDLNCPLWWDEDDSAIASLLNKSPVPGAIRHSAHQKLLATLKLPSNDSSLSKISITGRKPLDRTILDGACLDGSDTSSESEMDVSPQSSIRVPTPSALPRTANRRSWLAISTLAAGVLLGLFWWSSNSQLSTDQLVVVCDKLLSQSNSWETADGQLSQSEMGVVSEALNKFLTVYPSGTMETRALKRNEVAADGRLWKIPLDRGSELYVLVFNSPRDIKYIDSRLNLLSGSSLGWSTAAVRSSDRLIVFMSKDDLKRSLRFMPLA